MSSVPRMSLVVPIRRRLQFTTNLLPTAFQHAARDHEIIIVLDACPMTYEIDRRPDFYTDPTATLLADDLDRAHVREYLDSHADLLRRNEIRLFESQGDPRCWTGGLRTSAALNLGVTCATTDWIVGIGDEDLCFLPGWDLDLWRALEGRDEQYTVSTLVMVMPAVRDSWPTPWQPNWIHAQRERVSHQLSFPVLPDQANADTCRISEKTWSEFAHAARLPGIHEEECGPRKMAHWVPMLMHRSVLERAQRWLIEDDAAYSFDIKLDDRLGRMGVKKRMALDAHVLHAKHHLFINEETDKTWGDPLLLRTLARKPIL